MISLIEYFKELLWPSYSLYEMSNIGTESTGLDYQIWIQHRTWKERHWARLKIYPYGSTNKRKYMVISIEDNPKIKFQSRNLKLPQKKVNKILKFIKLNKEVLLQFWNDMDMSIEDLLGLIKRID